MAKQTVIETIYATNADNTARYLLGTEGSNQLVCIGVNPSTAEPGAPDPTVTKLMGFADRKGYDSWVMLNLYPQRSTDPTGMHLTHDLELSTANEQHIAELIGGRQITLLAAWGNLIDTRDYLLPSLEGIVAVADASGCDWVSIGNPIANGHPRHPSRAAYDWPLQTFDMPAYVATLKARAQRRAARRAASA